MSPTSRPDVFSALRAHRVVPLIVTSSAEHIVPLGRALLEGGLPIAEVALRSTVAIEALARLAEDCPEVLVGAGTVLREQQVNDAAAAGARFIVSPGLNEAVVRRSQELALPVIPGVCTPTEVDRALSLGLTTLKFFPAEPLGGCRLLSAIAAPFLTVRFVPTGGITEAHLPTYLAHPAVIACGGSWMAPQRWIDEGRFDEIRDAVVRTVASVRSLDASP